MRVMVLGTMQRLVSLIEQDLLKPLLAQTFPLHELGKAQETFLQKKHVGNIVVEI
jgi:NADPH:quinone reductase-like Zn-dependent oxidoreductase